jgi:hypothetical protein
VSGTAGTAGTAGGAWAITVENTIGAKQKIIVLLDIFTLIQLLV